MAASAAPIGGLARGVCVKEIYRFNVKRDVKFICAGGQVKVKELLYLSHTLEMHLSGGGKSMF